MKRKILAIVAVLILSAFMLWDGGDYGVPRASAAPTSTLVQALRITTLGSSGNPCLIITGSSGAVSTSTCGGTFTTTTIAGLTDTTFLVRSTSTLGISTSTSPSTIWVGPDKSYLTVASSSTDFVPYTGATGDVDLEGNQLTADTLIGTSGFGIWNGGGFDFFSDAGSDQIGSVNASASGVYQFGNPDGATGVLDFSAVDTTEKTFTFPNADGTIALTSDITFLLDGTPDVDHTANGPQTSTFNASTTVAAMELVYMNAQGGWALTDADATSTTAGMLSVALESGTNGNAMKVATKGSYLRDDSWNWTLGVTLYASTTPGAITASQPSGSDDVIRTVGYAMTADVIYFDPSPDWITHL